jgi:hypothetical protein
MRDSRCLQLTRTTGVLRPNRVYELKTVGVYGSRAGRRVGGERRERHSTLPDRIWELRTYFRTGPGGVRTCAKHRILGGPPLSEDSPRQVSQSPSVDKRRRVSLSDRPRPSVGEPWRMNLHPSLEFVTALNNFLSQHRQHGTGTDCFPKRLRGRITAASYAYCDDLGNGQANCTEKQSTTRENRQARELSL